MVHWTHNKTVDVSGGLFHCVCVCVCVCVFSKPWYWYADAGQ